jgi:hypothetical protein
MAQNADKKGASPKESPQPRGDGARAGHVEVDTRGRNVWRWAREGIDSTSVLLKGLENKDLALEPTQKVPVVPNADRAPPRGGRPPTDAGASTPGAKAASGAKAAAGAKQPSRNDRARPNPGRNDGGRDRGGGFDPYNSR